MRNVDGDAHDHGRQHQRAALEGRPCVVPLVVDSSLRCRHAFHVHCKLVNLHCWHTLARTTAGYSMPLQLLSAIGLVTIIALTWLISSNRNLFPWRPVIGAMLLQFAFAILIL